MGYLKEGDLKIIYMGTPEISAHVLSRLIEAGFDIVAVISNEDKPIGRKKVLEPTPVKQVALAHDIPVYQPHRIRLDHDFLKGIPCDLIVTMAYGQIVPKEVLDHPKIKAVNLHGSLLPLLRGAAPIQRAIMEGYRCSGVTLMEMVEAMDAGDMYAKKEVEILPSDNYTSYAEKIGQAAAELALENLLKLANGELKGIPQDPAQVSFADKIKPEDEHLPLHVPANVFCDYVRGLSLTPGGYLYLEDKKLKVLGAHYFEEGRKGEAGEIVSAKKGLFLQLEDAIVSLDLLQLEGKKMMDAKSFANGIRDLEGKKLS